MTTVRILALIFAFIVALVAIAESEHTKREKERLKSTLRSEESKHGYAEGYFSTSIGKDENERSEALEKYREKLETGFVEIKKKLRDQD